MTRVEAEKMALTAVLVAVLMLIYVQLSDYLHIWPR
jgi:hypothetical protein